MTLLQMPQRSGVRIQDTFVITCFCLDQPRLQDVGVVPLSSNEGHCMLPFFRLHGNTSMAL